LVGLGVTTEVGLEFHFKGTDVGWLRLELVRFIGVRVILRESKDWAAVNVVEATVFVAYGLRGIMVGARAGVNKYTPMPAVRGSNGGWVPSFMIQDMQWY
jgi:hypothetical protein